jgi:hypothetical protein
MGSLICGLLLIIAVSCTCKLIALRHAEDSAALSRSNGPIPTSDPHLMHLEPDGFFCYREPPPSYAAAVGDAPAVTFDSGDRRRMRRMRRHRRRPLSPPPILTPHSSSMSGHDPNLTSDGPSQRGDLFSVVGESTQHNARGHVLEPEGKESDDDDTKSQCVTVSEVSRDPDPATGSLVTIELDPMSSVRPVRLYECDQEPLLHSP